MTNEYKKKLNSLTNDEKSEREKYLRKIALGEIQGPLTGYPSIDMPQLQFYDDAFNENDIPKKSIYQYAYDNNIDNMDSIAIDQRGSFNGFEEVYTITYRQLFDLIDRNARSSKALGIAVDEIVPIIFPNIVEARTMIYSNSKIGAISYPISPMLSTNVLERIINDNDVHNVFVFAPLYYKFFESFKSTKIKNIIVYGDASQIKETFKDSRVMSWDEYDALGEKYTDEIKPYYRDNHTAVVIGTSGTTGTSKGVCLTDRNVNAYALSDIYGKFFEGSFLDALLPSIGYGISMIHYQTVAGKKVYLISELLIEKVAEALEKIDPENMPGGPVHYINLLNSNLFKEGRVHRGKNYISGGASLPPIVESMLNGVSEGYSENGVENKNIIVRQGFGLSETGASGSYNKKGAYVFGSVGVASPFIKVGVFKPGTDEELPYGNLGELCMSSPMVMKEYLNNEAETNNVIKIHSDGSRWVHTGDIVYIDETGHIFHKDRIKNIFMRHGFNVHPTTIAEHISTLPFIGGCAVIGFEHPTEQSVPVAFFKLREESGLSYDEAVELLKKYCYSNLEETSIPYEYVEVDEIPVNAGGKIDTKMLKEISGIDYMKNISAKKRIRILK